MALGERFQRALVWASQIHDGQRRKGTAVPYVSHLLAVASLVLEAGGDEDQAIAALLHDAVEDRGVSFAEIEHRFGQRVARIVRGCTDVPDTAARSGIDSFSRKQGYLSHLRQEQSGDVLRISIADKLHNARSILADYRSEGERVWERFNLGRPAQLWYYRELVRTFEAKWPEDGQVQELARVVGRLREEVGSFSDTDLDLEAQRLRSAPRSRGDHVHDEPGSGRVLLVSGDGLREARGPTAEQPAYLGESLGGTRLPFCFQPAGAGRAWHLGILGEPAASTLLASMILTAYSRQRSTVILVLDPKGDLVKALRRAGPGLEDSGPADDLSVPLRRAVDAAGKDVMILTDPLREDRPGGSALDRALGWLLDPGQQVRGLLAVDLSVDEPLARQASWPVVAERVIESVAKAAERLGSDGRGLNALVAIEDAHRFASAAGPIQLIDAVRAGEAHGMGWLFISPTPAGLHREIVERIEVFFLGLALATDVESHGIQLASCLAGRSLGRPPDPADVAGHRSWFVAVGRNRACVPPLWLRAFSAQAFREANGLG